MDDCFRSLNRSNERRMRAEVRRLSFNVLVDGQTASARVCAGGSYRLAHLLFLVCPLVSDMYVLLHDMQVTSKEKNRRWFVVIKHGLLGGFKHKPPTLAGNTWPPPSAIFPWKGAMESWVWRVG